MTIHKGLGVYVLECLDRFLVSWSTQVAARVMVTVPLLPAPSSLRWVFTQAAHKESRELRKRLDEWRVHGDWFLKGPDTDIELSAFAEEWEERCNKHAKPLPKMIRISEFALLAGVSYRTGFRWVKSGRLHAVKVGTQWRIPVRELLMSHPVVFENIQDDSGPRTGHAIRFLDESMPKGVHSPSLSR